MSRIICPICGNGYAHYESRKTIFKKVVWKNYECDNCGHIEYDLRTYEWYPTCDKCNNHRRLELMEEERLTDGTTTGLYRYECVNCHREYVIDKGVWR